MSGYIAITVQGNERRVAWRHSYREAGKSAPCSSALHLGVLAPGGAELLRCRRRRPEDFTQEILDALSRKGIVLGERVADTVGRKPTVLTRITVRELASSQVVMVGVYRVLRHLAVESGLLPSLKSAFGDDAEAVFALACHRLDSRQGVYLAQDWAEQTPFRNAVVHLSPSSAGRLLAGVAGRRLAFFKAWYSASGRPQELIEDSTHFCTRAGDRSRREAEEHGWEHHQEDGLRQINVMSLVARPSRLPVMYRAYFGSINDISTFTETSEEMEVVGEGVSREYISDCGYFSDFNLGLMLRNGDDFTIEAKWNNRTGKIWEEHRASLEGHGETVRHGGLVYRHEPCEYILPTDDCPAPRNRVSGHIYYCALEHSRAWNALRVDLADCKEKFSRYAFRDAAQAREWLDTCTGGLGKYLQVVGDRDFTLRTDDARVDADTEKAGFHIILSTVPGRDAAETMETIHGRDPVEKLWHEMKSELGARRLGTKMDDTTQGEVFIVWCAAILRRLLAGRMGECRVEMTMAELLLALRKVTVLVTDRRVSATTLTRKSKDAIAGLRLEKLFEEFEGELASTVEARTKRENPNTRHPGRPPKYKLKEDAK